MRERATGVYESDDGRLATANLVPGTRVYDEDLFSVEGREMRSWNPQRSKLAAFLLKGGRTWPFDERTRVLYLGAANGTTPSHVSDLSPHGLVYALEFSARSFRDLLAVSEPRSNMVPILADAWRPDMYAHIVGDVDVVYMDIAQRNQAEIFARNLVRFRPKIGILMVKARSVDVTREPRDVYAETEAEVERIAPYHVIEGVELGPFEKDHAAVVVAAGAAPPRAPVADRPTHRPSPNVRGGAPRDARDARRGPPRGDRPAWRGPSRGPPSEG